MSVEKKGQISCMPMTYLSIAVKAGVSESEGRQPCKHFCWKVAQSTAHSGTMAERSTKVGAAKKSGTHTTTAAAVSENNSNNFDRSQCFVNTRSERIRREKFSKDRMRSINCDEEVNKLFALLH